MNSGTRKHHACLLMMAGLLLMAITARAEQNKVPSSEKMIWATSWIWIDAPEIKVKKWLSDKPEFKNKFILVEFWRTWCGACKRITPLLNELHEKYGEDLVVMAITGETEDAVKKYKGPEINYFFALDNPRETEKDPEIKPDSKKKEETAEESPDISPPEESQRTKEQGALEQQFGVWGWPHCVLLEPEHRTVIWEGFPGLKGHELTVEKIGKYIAISKKSKGVPEKP